MKRALIITSVAIALLAVMGGVAYTFGTPQSPDAVVMPASGAASASGAAAMPAGVADASSGSMSDVPLPSPDQKPPAPDPNAPLAIQIPGCRCHSDDPKIVEEHSAYRMNQCAGCHGGQTPTGQ